MSPNDRCIVNSGGGSWAFAALARQLSDALWVDVSETPRRHNYLLFADAFDPAAAGELFISVECMELAADKRRLAEAFSAAGVPTPETRLFGSLDEALRIAAAEPGREWCLKFPTGCGAAGHRMLTPGMTLPESWPLPLVVQEFIRVPRPEVYRLYGAGGKLFGWVARRFPPAAKTSPWVAHARGARYEAAGEPPAGAVETARSALEATGLLRSFGCADLLCRPDGKWVALEVGTDGQFNHVDRDLGLPEIETEIQRRIAEAFWAGVGRPPWGTGAWHPWPSAAQTRASSGHP